MTGTRAPVPVCSGMDDARKVWLVHNESSGSNDEAALGALRDAFGLAGLEKVGETCFPRDDAPGPAQLDACGADMLAIFAGDGTISSVVAGVSGWSGAVLPLPGGTMNMLARRLHGDSTAPEIVDRFERGVVTKVRPTVLRSRHGVGLTGALAGPGTAWAHVREAMRDIDVKELLSSASEAISASTGGPKVVCLDSDCGREEGYTAVTLTPQDDGIEIAGYYTQSLADYARHGVALLQRDFRNGPHEVLGRRPKVRLACPGGEPMGLLIDGEPYEGQAQEEFELGTSDVDFWATAEKD
jgi:Diacylglycerol kinase catalytic domain